LNFLKATFLPFTLAAFLGLSSNPVAAQRKDKSDENIKFSYACYTDPKSGLPTTFATREGDEGLEGIRLITWESRHFKNYHPIDRCKIISERLNRIGTDSLRYLTNSWLNGQPVICVAANKSPRQAGCTDSRLVFTLENLEEANDVLSYLIEVAEGGKASPLRRVVLPSEGGKLHANMKNVLRNSKPVRLGNRL
jgi:hypothetical protein